MTPYSVVRASQTLRVARCFALMTLMTGKICVGKALMPCVCSFRRGRRQRPALPAAVRHLRRRGQVRRLLELLERRGEPLPVLPRPGLRPGGARLHVGGPGARVQGGRYVGHDPRATACTTPGAADERLRRLRADLWVTQPFSSLAAFGFHAFTRARKS
jgi:hypothetical protein